MENKRKETTVSCPLCGAKITLGASECPVCKYPFEKLGLARAGSVKKIGTKRRLFSLSTLSLSQLNPRRRQVLILYSILFFAFVITLALMLSRGGKTVKFKTPEEAVRAYYSALERKDAKGVIAPIIAGYRPTGKQFEKLEIAIKEGSWKFSGLKLRKISEKGDQACFALEDLRATIDLGGGRKKANLTTDVIAPLQNAKPGAVLIIRLEKVEGSWEILSRPLNGWVPESLWVIGEPGY